MGRTRCLLPMVAAVVAVGGCSTGPIWKDVKYPRFEGTTYWSEGADSAVLGRFGSKEKAGRDAFHPETWLDYPDVATKVSGPYEIKVATETSRKFVADSNYEDYVEAGVTVAGDKKLKVGMVVMIVEVDPDVVIHHMNEDPSVLNKLKAMKASDDLPRVIYKVVIILKRAESEEITKEMILNAKGKLKSVDGKVKLLITDSSTKKMLLEITDPVVRCYLMGIPQVTLAWQVVRFVPDVPARKDKSPWLDY